jgi:hypothetical protein
MVKGCMKSFKVGLHPIKHVPALSTIYGTMVPYTVINYWYRFMSWKHPGKNSLEPLSVYFISLLFCFASVNSNSNPRTVL